MDKRRHGIVQRGGGGGGVMDSKLGGPGDERRRKLVQVSTDNSDTIDSASDIGGFENHGNHQDK